MVSQAFFLCHSQLVLFSTCGEFMRMRRDSCCCCCCVVHIARYNIAVSPARVSGHNSRKRGLVWVAIRKDVEGVVVAEFKLVSYRNRRRSRKVCHHRRSLIRDKGLSVDRREISKGPFLNKAEILLLIFVFPLALDKLLFIHSVNYIFLKCFTFYLVHVRRRR
jgi:hypothetical protein